MTTFASNQAQAQQAPAPRVPRDDLGCSAAHLAQSNEWWGDGFRFFRKRTAPGAHSLVEMPASDRGFLLGISMSAGHRRRIHHAHGSRSHEFDVGSIYLRGMDDDYRAELQGGFDFMLLEIPRPMLDRTAGEDVGRRFQGLASVTAVADPVLQHLAQALAPALAGPRQASALFIEQMAVLMQTHLVDRYGGGAAGPVRAPTRLSRSNESRAKDMLTAGLAGGGVSIAEVADACRLSRSYFIRAFTQSVGQTPYQWLQSRRIDLAKGLLAHSTAPLAEVAVAAGFSDQSHFTRVFSRVTGMPPARWRRGQPTSD